LGDVLKEGSYVMGYDLSSLNLSGYIDDHSTLKDLPEVILIKKSYQEAKNLKKRIWKLKQLEKEQADTKAMNRDNEKRAKDYEDFLNDLETDPEMRSHVNMYRNEQALRDKEKTKMIDEGEEEAEEGTGKKKKKGGLKKKLKVKRKGKKAGAQAAAPGGDKDEEDDKDQDENKDANAEKEADQGKQDKDEDDPLVRVEELLADLTLEDQIVENNDDAIDEFISRLEKVKIEGKE